MKTDPNVVVVQRIDKEGRDEERHIKIDAKDKDLVTLDRTSLSSFKTVQARKGN